MGKKTYVVTIKYIFYSSQTFIFIQTIYIQNTWEFCLWNISWTLGLLPGFVTFVQDHTTLNCPYNSPPTLSIHLTLTAATSFRGFGQTFSLPALGRVDAQLPRFVMRAPHFDRVVIRGGYQHLRIHGVECHSVYDI